MGEYEKKKIPVALASDNNYRLPLLVAIYSIVSHALPETEYLFKILVPEDFNEDTMKKINQLLNKYHMPTAEFFNMQQDYNDIQMNIAHISHVTYYRLKLVSLLKDIDRCIYLDVDIIVKDDLSELMDLDMKDAYIAGVKAAGYYYPAEKRIAHLHEIGACESEQYINAGMLVMNLKKMREDQLESVFEKLLERNFRDQDQDILNCACCGKKIILPPKFNAMNKYLVGNKDAYDKNPCLPICYSRDEWYEACDRPVIIHYADKWKPWEDISGTFVWEWWEQALRLNEILPCLELLLKNMIEHEIHHRQEVKGKIEGLYSEKADLNEKLNHLMMQKTELDTHLQMANDKEKKNNEELDVLKKKLRKTRKQLKSIKESRGYRLIQILETKSAFLLKIVYRIMRL